MSDTTDLDRVFGLRPMHEWEQCPICVLEARAHDPSEDPEALAAEAGRQGAAHGAEAADGAAHGYRPDHLQVMRIGMALSALGVPLDAIL